LVESCAKKNSDGLWSPLAEKTWILSDQLKLKRKISSESLKRAIEDCTPTALPTPPSSDRGKKRKHVSDDEEEEQEQEGDQRHTSMVEKWYTRKLQLKPPFLPNVKIESF